MPYYVHPKNTDPTTGEPFTSRADAHARHKALDGSTVTFQLNDDERHAWREREWQRFRDGVYVYPPWIEDQGAAAYWERWDAPDYQYAYPALVFHFAHLSLKHPGKVAYTPDDEHGYQDRQIVITPGRYLAWFGREYFSDKQIASFVARVKACGTDGLRIARTEAEIIHVYTHGPGSCMAHPVDDYHSTPIHPVAVYGDSDLGVAYLEKDGRISARCLVWPDRKLYSRIYGDDKTLRVILEREGYTNNGEGEYGSFEGARIRLLHTTCGRIVAPYVDVADSVDASSDGRWLILRGPDDKDGEYGVRDTDGFATPPLRNTCEHCGTRIDDDEIYCESCADEQWTCPHCDNETFDSQYTVDGVAVCATCYDDTNRCDGCRTRYFEGHWNFADAYCESCAEQCAECDKCGAVAAYDDLSDGLCESCADEREMEAADLPPDAPRIARTFRVTYTGRGGYRVVAVLDVIGPFVIHKTVNGGGYTVTHGYTGDAVISSWLPDLDVARLAARALLVDGVDWGFRDCNAASSATRDHTREVAKYLSRREFAALETLIAPAPAGMGV